VNGFYLRLVVAWLLCVGAGCTSAPVRYYTLSSPPDQTSPVPETTLAIDVRIVHTPPQLKRAELMARTSLTEVTLLENERWASPVNDEIKDALRLQLQRRRGGMTALRVAFAKLTIDIDVQHFEAVLGGYALLEVSWSANSFATGGQSAGARPTTCTFRAVEKIGTGYAEMVEGYQREITALAEAIVAVLTSPANGLDASCQ
jgi:uncharacterized lipoprotein YmbA